MKASNRCMKVLAPNAVRRGSCVEIAAARGSNRVVEEGDRAICDPENLGITGEAMIPCQPEQRECMRVAIPRRVGDAAVSGHGMYPTRLSVAFVERGQHVFDASVGEPPRVGIPSQQAGMTVDV